MSKKPTSTRQAHIYVTCDSKAPDQSKVWQWTVRMAATNGNDDHIVARSVAWYPSESQARGEGWAVYQALRRGEGDRKKWGHW